VQHVEHVQNEVGPRS